MNRDQLIQSLLETIGQTFRSIKSLMHPPEGGIYNLSHPQRQILFNVYQNEKDGQKINVKDLAKQLKVTSAAITQFSDELVRKEFLSREIDLDDRRIIRLKLTEKTYNTFKRFKDYHLKQLRPMFEDFSEDELEQFITLLSKIKTNGVK
jgi:DNA-binding MarR family transcriptional regulator